MIQGLDMSNPAFDQAMKMRQAFLKPKNVLPDCQYKNDAGGYYNTCLT